VAALQHHFFSLRFGFFCRLLVSKQIIEAKTVVIGFGSADLRLLIEPIDHHTSYLVI